MIGAWWANEIRVLSVTVFVYWTQDAGPKTVALETSATRLREASALLDIQEAAAGHGRRTCRACGHKGPSCTGSCLGRNV